MILNIYLLVLFIYKLSYFHACSPTNTPNQVIVGDNTYVCLNLGPINWQRNNETNGYYLQTANIMKADQMSSIQLNDSWTSTVYANDTLLSQLNISQVLYSGVTISIESMGVISYPRLYRAVIPISETITTTITNTNTTKSTSITSTSISAASVTFPLIMAIINVDHGKVNSILWDDTCKWCSSNQCENNIVDYNGNSVSDVNPACYIPDNECLIKTLEPNPFNSSFPSIIDIPSHKNSIDIVNNLCKLNVFVTWTGTDANGYFFDSSASRFSRIAQTQLINYTNRRMNERNN